MRALTPWPALVALVLVAVAVALSAGASRAAPGGVNGAIAFDCSTGICLINPDGSGATSIPGTSGGERARWSPDGSSLTFMKGGDVWTVDPDGSNLFDHGPGFTPSYSWDGGLIYFNDNGGNFYSVPATNTVATPTPLTAVGSGYSEMVDEPNGGGDFAFSGFGFPSPLSVFTSSDQTTHTLPTHLIAGDGALDPAWSPDSSVIYFAYYTGSTYQIDSIAPTNFSGSPTVLVPSYAQEPAPSPDGTELAYIGGSAINVAPVNSDGSIGAGAPIPNTSNISFDPAWQPMTATYSPTLAITSETPQVAAGGTIAASASLSGTGGANTTGTITLTAYTDSSCTTPAGHTESVAVTAGDGTYTGTGFAPAAGDYYWSATYSGDAATDTYGASSACSGPNGASVVVPTGGAWIGSGSASNAGTTTVVNDGTLGPAQFSYDVPGTDPGCCSVGSWQFETVAGPGVTTVTLPWTYSGTNAFFEVQVGLQAFVTHAGVTSFTPLVSDGPTDCCSPPSAAFGFSGTTTLNVSPGDVYGFQMTGSNGDLNPTLQGTLTVNGPVVTPTLTNDVPAGAPLGSNIKDTVTLAHGADGSITFNAYSSSDCSTASLDTETVTVNGDGPYTTPIGLITPPLGTYYWQVSYSGNATTHTPGAVGVCGGPTGSTVITPVLGGTNDSWNTATPITLNNGSGSVTTDSLDQSGDARWYKVNVTPGGTLTVDLSNLPANYDLAVFSDIGQAFNELTGSDLTGTNALQTVSAESGNDAFSPSVFSPSVFSPSVFSPSVFSPSVFSPSVFSPSVFSPSVFSPSVFSPSVFSPSNPEDAAAYTGAQTRSLIAISANDGTAPEHVFADIWNNTGSFYIRVNGRNGTYDPGKPFTVSVTENTGTCTSSIVPDTTDPHLDNGVPTTLPSNLQTLILTNEDRMKGSAADFTPANFTTMNNELATFATHVNGTVVDLDSVSARVRNLETQADGDTSCPYAKNLVANAIRDIVTDYRAKYPSLKYIVIVGDDNAIPFFRYPDTAGIGPESDYVPPVLDPSASEASLQSNDVLSEDAYGATSVLHLKGLDLPIPDLPVGRLVKTPLEITGLLSDYLTLPGGYVTPSSSLVTGYDFMANEAKTIGADLSAGTGNPTDSLISDQGTAPSDSWTASQLSSALLGPKRHDMIFLGGHFSANNTLAADYSTTLNATDVAQSGVNLVNSIVFSQGCHSGYSIVNSDAVPGVTQTLDWTEAFAQKGATLIAGTGYQYGDTDFLAYSAQLYTDFAQSLLYGSGPVAVGSALVQAKQTYLNNTPNLQGIDIKSLLEATLYGLPMLGVDMPAGRTAAPTTTSNVAPITFGSNPGLTLGLSSADVALSPALTTTTTNLKTPTNGSGPTATYLSGPNGVETSPGAPTLPLATTDVSVAGQVLRGVGFRGGTYTDATGITPLTGAPATELNNPHSPFVSSAFFPSRLWTVNYFPGLTGTPASTFLNLTPVQYETDTPGSLTDRQRTFSKVNLRLFYSDNTQPYGANTPALAAPPTISRVDATSSAGAVTFRLHVVGDPSAGIQQVWVTYTGVDGGTWESLDLTQDPVDSTLWTGTLGGLTTQQVSDLQFIVQAVNGVGLVSLDDNQGSYYGVDQIAPALQSASAALTGTQLTINNSPLPLAGDYGSSPVISATLTNATDTPIIGEQVTFAIGGSSVTAITGAGGIATAPLPLVDVPGTGYQLTAGFEGDATYASSSDSAAFTIKKLATSLTLSGNSTVNAGADTGISATLQSGTVGLSQRTVGFVLTPASGPAVTQTRITDLNGKASLGVVAGLATGIYTVKAYFASPGSGVTLPVDPVYSGQVSGTSQLTIGSAAVSSITLVGTSPTNAASVSWTVTFNQSVTGVSAANFSLVTTGVTGAGSIGVTGSGATYTVTASTGSGSGTIGLNLSTTAGIPGLNGTFTGQVYTVDKTAPTVTSINLAGVSPTNASSLAWTVTFSEPVSNVVAADFTAVGSGLTGGTGLTIATPVATGGAPSASWTVTVAMHGAAGANSGSSVKLNLTSVGTIQDVATNRLAGTRNGDQAYGYDTTAPKVANVTSTLANGSYKAGQVVPITVTFSEPVNVTGTPQLTLALTPASRAVNYTSGSGTSTLNFNYTVQAGDTSADLNYAATSSLALNGGTIKDAATNNATLTLPGPTATGSLGTNKAIVIDTTAPKVLSINLGAASPTTATSVSWKLTFSESVTGVKASSFSLVQTGLSGAGGITVTGSGAAYTVTASTGTGTGTLGLNLSTPAGIADAATNALSGTFTGQIYTIAAKLASGTTTCNGIYMGVGANVTVPANGTCTLLPGTAVASNVTVGTGGTLSMLGVLVGNNVQATGAAGIGISASAIGHDIQISGTKGKGPGGSDSFICATAVAHDLVVQSGAATAAPFVIGGAPDCAVPNTMGHDLVVTGNQNAVVVNGNVAGHDVTIQNNTGGATITKNSAAVDAACSGNTPQTGSGNKGTHSNSCPR